MCRELFEAAKYKLNCPVRLFPNCHPGAHLDAYVMVKTRTVTLCCSQCDRPVAVIHARSGRNHNGKTRKAK